MNRIAFLQQLASNTSNEMDKFSIYDEIVELSKTALDKIDQNDLFRYFGQKHHDSSEDKKYLKNRILFIVITFINFFFNREYENQKAWLIELLCSQGVALIEKNKSEDTSVMSTSVTNDLKTIYKSIQKWVDITDEKVID